MKLVILLVNDLMLMMLMEFLDIDVFINLCVSMVLIILCYIWYGWVCDIYFIGDVEVEVIEV